jgi:hypothetical protein
VLLQCSMAGALAHDALARGCSDSLRAHIVVAANPARHNITVVAVVLILRASVVWGQVARMVWLLSCVVGLAWVVAGSRQALWRMIHLHAGALTVCMRMAWLPQSCNMQHRSCGCRAGIGLFCGVAPSSAYGVAAELCGGLGAGVGWRQVGAEVQDWGSAWQAFWSMTRLHTVLCQVSQWLGLGTLANTVLAIPA